MYAQTSSRTCTFTTQQRNQTPKHGRKEIFKKSIFSHCGLYVVFTAVMERNELLDELQKNEPDFDRIQQLVSLDTTVLNVPIDHGGRYVLHHLCMKDNVPVEIIQLCIQEATNSQAIQKPDSDGRYPLHLACMKNHSEQVIQLLITNHRIAIEVADNYGLLPLHVACYHHQSERIIQLLKMFLRAAIRVPDNHGRYPLHIVCMKKYSEQFLQSIIREYPIALEQRDDDGCYPLHYACQHYGLRLVQRFIHEYPIAVQQPCANRMYPLHYACQHSPYISVVLLLLYEYPPALGQQCIDLRYNPLHWICKNKGITMEPFIEHLEGGTFPISMAATQQQSGGCTPLHMACEYQQSLQTIEYLYEQSPDAMKLSDNSGYLPLHFACEHNQSYDVIQYLINRYPEGVTHATNDGWLPLHIACAYGQSLSVIDLLFSKKRLVFFDDAEPTLNPIQLAVDSGASEEIIQTLRGVVTWLPHQNISITSGGNLEDEFPLHYATQYDGLEEIRTLIQQYPEAIQQRCTDGMYPLHYACKKSTDPSVIQLLLLQYPMALEQQCNFLQYTPLHWLCINEYPPLDILIQSLLSFRDEFCNALARQNNCGRTPLHLACEYNQSLLVIQHFVEQGMRSIEMPDICGYLPLHTACGNDQTDAVIELLLRTYPRAASTVSREGELPLHIACSNRQSIQVIKLLVSEYPWALSQRTLDGCYPLQLTEEANAPKEIASYLHDQTIVYRFQIFCQIPMLV